MIDHVSLHERQQQAAETQSQSWWDGFKAGIMRAFEHDPLLKVHQPPMLTTSPVFSMPALPGDVGYNLPASERVELWPGEYAQVHCDVRVAMPAGTWGLILPRSSANRTGKLVVLPGVIDNGYRGELTVMVHNVERRAFWRRSRPVIIEKGHSLAQLVLFPILTPPLERVETLDQTTRGEAGYGSTGKAAL